MKQMAYCMAQDCEQVCCSVCCSGAGLREGVVQYVGVLQGVTGVLQVCCRCVAVCVAVARDCERA